MSTDELLPGIIKLGDSTIKKIVMVSMASQAEGETPSTFFNKHNKPTLSILEGPLKDFTQEKWNSFVLSIWKHLTEDSLNVEWVKTFIYFFFRNEKTICPEPWISYGITLTEQENEEPVASPWSIIKINLLDQAFPGQLQTTTDMSCPPELSWKLAQALTGINRIVRVSNRDYKDWLLQNLQSRIGLTQFGSRDGSDLINFNLASTAYASWAQDAGYCKMMAALDMYYYRFKMSQYAETRWGTIPCRDKDLGAMTALEDLRLQTESSLVTEVLSWVWLESIGREIAKLMSYPDDLKESIKPFSYFHYQSDLGAISSSMYASVHNRKLYTLTHMVGTLLNQRRSYNAYLIEANNVHSIYKNAIFIAYACRVSHNMRPVGAPESKKDAFESAIEEVGDDDQIEETGNPEPTTRDPLEWFVYWRGLTFAETARVQTWQIGRAHV